MGNSLPLPLLLPLLALLGFPLSPMHLMAILGWTVTLFGMNTAPLLLTAKLGRSLMLLTPPHVCPLLTHILGQSRSILLQFQGRPLQLSRGKQWAIRLLVMARLWSME